jgi:hypothetical protein
MMEKKRHTDINISTFFDRDQLTIYLVDDTVHELAVKGH